MAAAIMASLHTSVPAAAAAPPAAAATAASREAAAAQARAQALESILRTKWPGITVSFDGPPPSID